MEMRAEQTPAEATLTPSARTDVRAEVNRLLKDIEVLRQLLALHGEHYDSRGRSVFARAVDEVIDERLKQLRRLTGSATAPPYRLGSERVTEV
jgi:hypothetical protein